MVQPLIVIVLAALAPGPPDTDEELETCPPPACTLTDEPPAELLLETAPAVLPVVAPPLDEPAAVMLPSGCFSTVTRHVSPEAVFPVFSIGAAIATELRSRMGIAITRIMDVTP